ncbi:DUF927 domain-containing protein [Methylobacterium nigriterrae]|uniref:DUF927 domain-containing protein n=1 Tax=Methylobacterium nigriterrae TaxID=3127512 RepID=UPI0030140FB5
MDSNSSISFSSNYDGLPEAGALFADMPATTHGEDDLSGLRGTDLSPRPESFSADESQTFEELNPDESVGNEADDASGPAEEVVTEHHQAPIGDPFTGFADDFRTDETRRKEELFAWADQVSSLGEAELELELLDGAKRFGLARSVLVKIIKGRKSEKARQQRPSGGPESGFHYYGTDFRTSEKGVFVRRTGSDGTPAWDVICTTQIKIEALTRDARGENWGAYVIVTNRDGRSKPLAIPHALIAAEKSSEIVSTLASLGVGTVPGKDARQAIVQFLTTEVDARITSVPQIGWHQSDGAWVFVLPDGTLVPTGFDGARPVLQTASLQTQHGLSASGTIAEWIDQIARPLGGNSNVHLCVGTAFAGPLLYWANEPPGFFHVWGASKIAKSLAAAIGQTVWGRPKIPGEADAFGASWTATAVGLELYALLRSDIGGSFDEIGEGNAKVIRAAVYLLANGSTKLRGTQDISLRPMESFRVVGISTGEPTMQAFLSAGGETVPAGLSVRLVDVPAEVQPGSAFETCPVDQIEELGKQFYPATTRFHGAVGRAWLQHLVDLGSEEIQRRIALHREDWLAIPEVAAVRATGTGQVRSVINRFALIAAALRMAHEAGLLPWTSEDTDLGIAACMARWAAGRKGRLDLSGETVNAVEQIRAILAANLHGRFIHLRINDDKELAYTSSADENKRDTLGYVKNDRILIETTAWRSEVCAGFNPDATARHLRDEGLLHSDEGKLQKQERVLRGGLSTKARFYVVDMRILEEAAGTGPAESPQ